MDEVANETDGADRYVKRGPGESVLGKPKVNNDSQRRKWNKCQMLRRSHAR